MTDYGVETSAGFGRLELIRIAENVAQEKGIGVEDVIVAMEQAIQTAARRKYGQEHQIVAEVDRKTGDIGLYRDLEVAEEIADPAIQIALEEARERNPAAQIGDHILEPLPPIDLGRIAAQSAKQVIVQKVREAERERQYNEYKDRIGEIVVGEVKRIEYGNVLVDLGRAEAILRRDEMQPRETFRNKDRVRAYVYDVRPEARGPQIFLSRTHPQFMASLFAQEVPEIYDGIIEIKSVARDPGSRAKIAVVSKDSSIDPVGACVGMRGSRVQAVVNELSGEKIDIIPWSPDPATFVVNALAPAEVSKVVLDEESRRIEVIVPDAQLSLAIGRRGQNVRLASQLTGWDIDIVTESEDAERRSREFKSLTEYFVERPERRGGDRAAAGHRRVQQRRRAALCRSGGARLDPGLRRERRGSVARARGAVSEPARGGVARGGGGAWPERGSPRLRAAVAGAHRRARPQRREVARRSGRSCGRRAGRAAARGAAHRSGRRQPDHGGARPLVRRRGCRGRGLPVLPPRARRRSTTPCRRSAPSEARWERSRPWRERSRRRSDAAWSPVRSRVRIR